MKHAHVTLTDSGTRALVWTGSLKEFFGANEMPRQERREVCTTLRQGGTYHFGGGAAPGWTLAKIGAHLATLAVAAVLLVGCATVSDGSDEYVWVKLRADAPDWCSVEDPDDNPHGDYWYESCAEPRQ